ncbi:twin transmembrane helix small protein [Marinicella meishanensis]|uniref:twin transmembrane helix small protein n=1 Tax=Marinicella meishanensis TaxID=2873263 RepID=UPI001CBD894B|nr:twin transmembrane helix small protein [Marinicella sp. NBU2979]
MKYLIIVILLFILFSLGSAMFYLVKGKGQSQNTVRFLTVRVALSVLLFLFIILAAYMGWIEPHQPNFLNRP